MHWVLLGFQRYQLTLVSGCSSVAVIMSPPNSTEIAEVRLTDLNLSSQSCASWEISPHCWLSEPYLSVAVAWKSAFLVCIHM